MGATAAGTEAPRAATVPDAPGADGPIYVGIGANLGDAAGAVREAFEALAALPATRCTGRSALYRSAPIDAGGPDYVNAVAELRSTLSPEALLDALHRLEAQAGRHRPYRNAPRVLDLDLLMFGGRVVVPQPGHPLQLPHPRLHERAFVLYPLLELAPGVVHPRLGPLAALLPAVAGQRIERLG